MGRIQWVWHANLGKFSLYFPPPEALLHLCSGGSHIPRRRLSGDLVDMGGKNPWWRPNALSMCPWSNPPLFQQVYARFHHFQSHSGTQVNYNRRLFIYIHSECIPSLSYVSNLCRGPAQAQLGASPVHHRLRNNEVLLCIILLGLSAWLHVLSPFLNKRCWEIHRFIFVKYMNFMN